MNRVYRHTIILAILLLLSKFASFFKDIVLSSMYGASRISDAFIISLAIPMVLATGILTSLFTCYIPIYKEVCIVSKNATDRFNSNVLLVTILTSILFIVIYFIFDDIILRAFAIGMDQETFALTKTFTSIIIFSIISMGICYVLQGYLQANHKFYLVGGMSIPLNIIIALGICFSKNIGLSILPYSVVFGYLFLLLYFSIPSYALGFRIKSYINFKDKYLKKLIFMIVPIFLGQIIFEINSMVDKSAASTLPSGYITTLDYSFKVMAILYSVIATPISTVVYPKFSEYVVERNSNRLFSELNSVLSILMFIIIPITCGAVYFSKEIIEVLFYHGEFNYTSVILTSESFKIYCFSVVPISLRMIIEKVYYANQNPKIPMITSIIGIAVNILLDILLVHNFKHLGLAMATSISSIVACAVLCITLFRKNHEFNLCLICKLIVKYLFVSVSILFIINIFGRFITISNTILFLAINLIICAGIYAIVLYSFKDNIMILIFNIIRKKGKI